MVKRDLTPILMQLNKLKLHLPRTTRDLEPQCQIPIYILWQHAPERNRLADDVATRQLVTDGDERNDRRIEEKKSPLFPSSRIPQSRPARVASSSTAASAVSSASAYSRSRTPRAPARLAAMAIDGSTRPGGVKATSRKERIVQFPLSTCKNLDYEIHTNLDANEALN